MNKRFRLPELSRFSTKERTFFAKRMSFLIKAGVPLVEGLHLISAQTKSPGRKRVYDAVIADVTKGRPLSQGLGKFRRSFGDFAVGLIRTGEQGGILSQNLEYLADELQKQQALERKIIGALIYPALITIATLGITLALTAYIFPKLMPIFASLHVALPLLTRALIGISAFLRSWGIVTLLVIVLLTAALLVVRARYERVRRTGDRLLLKFPIAGAMVRAYNLANFCRTMSLLLKSGTAFADALAIAAETTENRIYRASITRLARDVVHGKPLSRGMAAEPLLYPDMLAHLIEVGERTGNLSSTLAYLGDFYEEEVDELSKGLSISIEPALMIVMGLLVGAVAVSVILPIYDITQHLNPR